MSNDEQLREALAQAHETIAEMQALLEKLTAAPLATGRVLQLLDGHVVTLIEGKTQLLEYPYNMEVEFGDQVILANSGQILDKVATHQFGEICTVRSANQDTGLAEIEQGGTLRMALWPAERFELRKGDRVLAQDGVILTENLGRENTRFKLANQTGITWENIGGLNDAKQELIEAIELPLLHPEIYKHYGKRSTKGILLYGPPGCGKTLLGKAAASSMQKIANPEAEGDVDAFMYVKGPEILDKYVGVAEQAVASIFQRARLFKEENGFPCVVFLDEADAILGKRGSGVSSDMEKTIVPMFLSEMDGMDENGALIILATNRADTLDPAILRDGRVDRKVGINRPDAATSKEIFQVHLRNIPVSDPDLTKDELAETAAERMFSEDTALYHIKKKDDSVELFNLGSIASGAMIEGIVDQAAAYALRRDIDEDAATGVHMEDLTRAIEHVTAQNRELDYKDTVKEYVAPFKSEVKEIARVR